MISFALLVLGIVALVVAANGAHPIRTWWGAALSWHASVYSVELAPQLMVLSGLGAAILASFGGLRDPRGWVGLVAVSLANVYLLTQAIRFRSNTVSLDPPLGFAELAASRYPRLHGALPFLVWRRAGVRRTCGIVYAAPGGSDLKLDAYAPNVPGDRLRPAVVYVHGGGLMTGSRRQGKPLLTHLAANGWVAFSIDYRLSPRATFPDHLVDVKRALHWLRLHGSEYHLDPSFIAIVGGSAGAHLSALAALTPEDKRLQPGFEDADTSVAALVGLYGLYDLLDEQTYWPRLFQLFERWVFKTSLSESPDAFRMASPMYRDPSGAPPTLIVYGDHDSLVPANQSRHFANRLRQSGGQPVYLAEIPGGQHAFDLIPSWRTMGVVEVVERFLYHTYLRASQSGDGNPLAPPTASRTVDTNGHRDDLPSSSLE